MPDQSGIPSSVLSLIVDQSHEGICLQDIQGRIEWINPACEAMFGWRLEEVRGRFAHQIIMTPGKRRLGPESNEFRFDFSRSIFSRNIVKEFQHRDGRRLWLQQSFAVLKLGSEQAQDKIVVTCRDVTDQVKSAQQLKKVNANLEYAANHDELTGLANRKSLNRFLMSEQVAAAIANRTIGVLQVDIDKFKDINDTLGHAAGDAILRHVATALSQTCGQGNLACRTGGDEFLLILLDSENSQILHSCAETLLEAISKPMVWKGQELFVGASIGACLATSPDQTGEVLIRRADRALYQAKHSGRGHVALYTDAVRQKYRAQMKTILELKRALAEKQFEIFLQPQLSLPTSVVTGCEALIRWNHPERGLLTPGQFLPAAERAGLSPEIDYMSMNLALDAFVRLRAEGFAELCMSINVSSAILDDVNYPGLLDWALQSRNISARNICVEILETTILEGGGVEIATAIERLKRLGVRIALDDFGTGYAGLAHMSAFDVDVIKLDRSMISRLASDPRNRMIIRSIIRLCSLLDIAVVAEGVETNNHLEILRRAKCPLIQGFGVARPMPVADTIHWLQTSNRLPCPLSLASLPKAETIPILRQGR